MGPDDSSQNSQRHRATVMFADISGFTALSEKLDPEEVTQIINGCFARLERVVLTHGGIVDEYLGDCVKAVFGLTPDTSDSTLHAVHAALELRQAVEQYNRDVALPSPLDIHIGLNTGYVVAGVLGGAAKRDYTVMGDAVRLAARLEHESGKGQIFVGPETHAETASAFTYRTLPSDGDNGDAPARLYELVGPRPRQRAKRDSERRQVTVLFADLLGLESVSDQTDPQIFQHVINRCFEVFSDAISRYGGVIDKYTGDGVMALFGVPNAIENAPQQALNAAIDLRYALRALNRELRLSAPLDVHVGVNTGLAIAGEIGGDLKRDYTVMGDTVNLAARLKEAAAAGAIYIGPETYRYTRDVFEVRPLQPLVLKGKQQPVSVYALTTEKKQVHRVTPAPSRRMVFSELVGRDAELARIKERLDALIDTGRGGIISLCGEAGMGKSRLMAEITASLADRPVLLWQGRCLSMGRSLSFHPFTDLLRQGIGIGEDEPEQVAQAKLRNFVESLFSGRAEDVFPFIATLMGMELTGTAAARVGAIEGEALEKLIFKSTRELLEAVAGSHPLIVVIEDLHWADLSSIQLLEALLRLVHERRVLFIHVFRPQFADTSDRVLATAREQYPDRHCEIVLEGLPASDALTLIQNLLNLSELPDTLRKLVSERAEGNPFYIEEVVRSLIDQGAVELVDGRFQVSTTADTVHIPGTVQDVIMSRIDRLDESARQLLQIASVIGRSFYHQIIVCLLENADGLELDLSALKEKQLLIERRARWSVAVGDVTLADEIEYIFQHALVQETIYNSILLKTRRELHGRVAQAFESLFAERVTEFYGLLAYHYTRAERWKPAEGYLFKAGEASIRSGASNEALNYFTEANRIYASLHGDAGDVAHRAALERNIGLALLNIGKLTESVPHFDTALRYLGDRVSTTPFERTLRVVADLTVLLGRLYLDRLSGPLGKTDRERFQIRYDRSRAQTTSDPRNAVFDAINGTRHLARSDPTAIEQACGMYTAMAALCGWSGISFKIGKRFLAVARGLAKPNSLRDEFAYRMWTFVLYYLEGDWSDEHLVPEALVDEAIRCGQFWDVNTYLGLSCERHIYRGEFAAARREIDRITELADVYAYDFARTNQDAMPGLLALMERRCDEAAAALERYSAGREEELLQLAALGYQAKCQFLAGDTAVADTLAKGHVIRKRLGAQAPGYYRSMLMLTQLDVDLRQLDAVLAGKGGSERHLVRRARRDAAHVRRLAGIMARERVEAYRSIGRMWWLLGRGKRAVHCWQRSVDEGARMGARPELARTYLEVGHRLASGRNAVRTFGSLTALDCTTKARDLFATLGMDFEKECMLLASRSLEQSHDSASSAA